MGRVRVPASLPPTGFFEVLFFYDKFGQFDAFRGRFAARLTSLPLTFLTSWPESVSESTTSVDSILSQTGYNCEITLVLLVNLAINVNRARTI